MPRVATARARFYAVAVLGVDFRYVTRQNMLNSAACSHKLDVTRLDAAFCAGEW